MPGVANYERIRPAMPTFIIPSVNRFSDVPLGALVGFVDPQNPTSESLGIRAESANDTSAVLIQLAGTQREGMTAVAWPWPNHVNPVPSDRYVLNYSQTWTLVTGPGNWDPTFDIETFAGDSAGLLLVGKEGLRGMSVLRGRDCEFLNLNTWQVEQARAGDYMKTRRWDIARPGIDGKQEWVFRTVGDP